MPDQRHILETLIAARQALNGVSRANPQGNLCHDDEGKFSGSCGGGKALRKPRRKRRKFEEFSDHELGTPIAGSGFRQIKMERRQSRKTVWDAKDDPSSHRRGTRRLQDYYDAHPIYTSPKFKSEDGEVGRIQIVKNSGYFSLKGESKYDIEERWDSKRWPDYVSESHSSNDYDKAVLVAKKWVARLHNETSLEMVRSLNGVVRFNPEGNIYHDDEGHFTGTGGHIGRKPKPPNKGRKPGEPTKQEARKQERQKALEEHRKEGHAKIADQRKSHAEARKDLVKGHKDEWKELNQDHAKAEKELGRDQAKELRELTRDQDKEHRKLDRDHEKERKADSKDSDADESDLKHREQTRKDDKDNLTEEHQHAIESVKEEHAQQIKELKEDQEQERKDKLAEFKDARKEMLVDHKQERQDLIEEFKDELKDNGFKKSNKESIIERSKAKLRGDIADHAAAIKSIVGKEVNEHEIASIAGLHDGEFQLFSSIEEINILGGNDQYKVDRTIKRDNNGRLVLHANSFQVNDDVRGQGIGASVFDRMTKQAKSLGVDRIETNAAGGAFNGYYTWPRFGYDANIPKEWKSALPEGFENAGKLSDLMKSEDGRKWWKENGLGMKMSFDLKEESMSNKIWDAYQSEKKNISSQKRSIIRSKTGSLKSKTEDPDFTDDEVALMDEIWDRIGKQPKRGSNDRDHVQRGRTIHRRSVGDGQRIGTVGVESNGQSAVQHQRSDEVGGGSGVSRRFSVHRTHKASSAESIVRHCLRQRGWTRAFRLGELTDEQHLDLLDDARQYGRAWLHHEAEALFQHYGREINEQRSMVVSSSDLRGGDWSDCLVLLEGVSRALGAAMARHVGRFFDRAKAFVRELTLAGAMLLHGAEPLTADEIRDADHMVQVQAAYLDRFQGEVIVRPPTAIAEQPTVGAGPEPMSEAQFAARAEQYGGSVVGSAQEISRRQAIRDGILIEEQRVLGKAEHCSDCPPIAGIWSPIGTLPAIGSTTECGSNCMCRFQYRDRQGRVQTLPRRKRAG